MSRLLLSFFLSGLVLGSTTCLVSCGVLLFPFAAHEERRWQAGVRAGLAFGLGRVLVYVCLGGLAGISHHLLEGWLASPWLLRTGGFMLLGLGVWFLVRPARCGACGMRRVIPPFLAGIFYGLVPCVPLTGFLVYVAYVSRGWVFGSLAGLLFGLGTLMSPLLVVAGFYPAAAAAVEKKTGTRLWVRIIGSAILVAWGVGLIIRGM